jgi:hypothetical protein
VTSPVSLPSFYCFRIFLFSLPLCNTSILRTWLVLLIFSVLLQQHISEFSRYIWTSFRSVQLSAPYKALFQMQHFMSFFLKFQSNLLVKRVFFLLTAVFLLAILNSISHVDLASLVIMLPKLLKYSTFSGCYWSIIICVDDGCLEILITLDFSTFISIPQHLPI